MKKRTITRQREYQIKLKKEKPAVYYSQRRQAQLKYRKTESFKKYHREYMRKWRARQRKQA
jgi:hypothetical protein